MTRPWLRQALYWTLAIAVSGILLYYSLRGVEWRRVWSIISHANLWYIGAALAISTWSFFLRSVRWRILLNAEGRFGVATVFWANMAGYFGNSFLPARAGEVLRSVLISAQSGLSKTYVLTTALSERMMDVIALVLSGSIVLMTVTPKPRWMLDASRAMAVVAVAGALFVVVAPHAGGLIESIVTRIPLPARVRSILLNLTGQILLGLRAFHHWGRLGGFAALTVIIWASDAVGVMVGAYALGLSVSFPVSMLLLTALGLGSALPSTPGYVGVYQFAAVTTLTPFGVSRDGAMAYILVAQVIGYVLVIGWGLPGMSLARRRGADDRPLSSAEAKPPR